MFKDFRCNIFNGVSMGYEHFVDILTNIWILVFLNIYEGKGKDE